MRCFAETFSVRDVSRFGIERLLLKLALNFSLRIEVVLHSYVQFSGESELRLDFSRRELTARGRRVVEKLNNCRNGCEATAGRSNADKLAGHSRFWPDGRFVLYFMLCDPFSIFGSPTASGLSSTMNRTCASQKIHSSVRSSRRTRILFSAGTEKERRQSVQVIT